MWPATTMPGILGAMHLLAPMPEHADHRLDFLFHLWGPRVVHARCEANFQPVYVDLKKVSSTTTTLWWALAFLSNLVAAREHLWTPLLPVPLAVEHEQ